MTVNLSSSNKQIDTILVLDFGSQYTQLIARRVRESNVYSEILPWDIDEGKIKLINPKGIILSEGRGCRRGDALCIPPATSIPP